MMAIIVDDEYMYFYVGIPRVRKPIKSKKPNMFKIQGNHNDYRWMYQCSECGLHFFEDEDSQIAKTGKCKKCRKET